MLFTESFAGQRLFLSYQTRIVGTSVFFPQQEGKAAEVVIKAFRAGTARSGGNSGSFHLKASNLSDFHLTDITKTPGLGSTGGKGSMLGAVEEVIEEKTAGIKKVYVMSNFQSQKRGETGKRGMRGKDGKNGIEGKVCLEVISEQSEEVLEESECVKEII